MSVKELFDLTGRVALVTGGSRGLGLQIAEALGEMGAKVAIAARKPAELEKAAEHLGGMGVDVVACPSDLSQPDQAAALTECVLRHWGQVDILVNNAGATWGAPTEEMPLEAWQKVIGLNLTAAFLLTQQVGKRSMIPRRCGRVINVASLAGLQGNHPSVMSTIGYNSSKGGLINFTRALAAEWGQYNINVNAIAPGFFPTKMSRGTIEHAGEFLLSRAPLGRLGGDEDLKGVAVLLASNASSYITGQVIPVDGGASII